MNGSSDIILKLFDTLKDSTDKNERTMQTLINQQQILVDNVTHLPIDEIKQDIKDHIVSAHEERKKISDKILKLDGKVVKMIIVVLVAFTLFTSAVMVARLSDKSAEMEISHSDLVDKFDRKFELLENKLNQKRSEKP
ncbi:MAG: hypothetical protein ACTSWJ_07805 [Candidatus Heimdallarchaeaceae archaeon]